MKDNFDVHEWNVRQLDEGLSGQDAVTQTIAYLRSKIYPNLTDSEMDPFVVGMCEFLDCTPPSYRLNEDEGTLNKIADILGDKFVNLRFDVNEPADRIDVRGSQQDLFNFGDKLHGSKIYGYEVFHVDDDDRGEIVRIVKSDPISRG